MSTILPSAIEDLRRRVTGPVYTPDDAEYEAECSGFQTAARHHPDVVVGVADAADVCAAIAYAGEHNQPVAVQGVGHGLSVPAAGGVLVCTRRLTDVSVDPDTRTASVGAGASWMPVIEAAAPHGLAPLAGSAPNVGAVAYTLGGGLGHLARRYGYAADLVRRLDVVTADAQLRTVTADSYPDLFWALRGGRDNIGLVTRLEVELVPVTTLYGGAMYFDTPHVPDVMRAYLDWTREQPDEMTTSLALIPVPDLPAFPEPVRGRYVASVRVAYLGPSDAGADLVAPLRAAGPRLIDTLGELPFTDAGSIYSDPTRPDAYYGTNALVRELPFDAAQSLIARTGPDAPVPCIVEIRHLGGALSRPASVPNAVGHRNAIFAVRVFTPLVAPWSPGIHAVHTRAFDAVAPFTVGRGLNFIYGERITTADVADAYEPADYGRLRELKRRYDPHNLFRFNLNVPPA